MSRWKHTALALERSSLDVEEAIVEMVGSDTTVVQLYKSIGSHTKQSNGFEYCRKLYKKKKECLTNRSS